MAGQLRKLAPHHPVRLIWSGGDDARLALMGKDGVSVSGAVRQVIVEHLEKHRREVEPVMLWLMQQKTEKYASK